MTIEEATVAANEGWIDHARPIIRAYLAMEEACMASAICSVHYGKDDISKAKTRDYREADGYRKEAQQWMLDMLDGIRDNYLCDNYLPYPMTGTDEEAETADEFNDALAKAVISVDAAVWLVEGEA